MKLRLIAKIAYFSFFIFAGVKTSLGEAIYRVHPDFEDTIRIVLIWNDAEGRSGCDSSTLPIGQKTLDFVKTSLNPSKVPNIREIRNSTTDQATWNDVISLWGGDTIPHVIVHINAGWSTGWNGTELETIFSNAISLKIGVVSIGDDAADLASSTFGFSGVENVPDPLGDATTIDSLWMGLIRGNDNKLKAYEPNGDLTYPGLNGIISNTIDSILQDSIMTFFPYGEGRCQADADKYNVLYPNWITMLGYQQGYWDNQVSPGVNELNVLVAIQDTSSEDIIRRGVALSFQPSFFSNITASEQVVYDAIMFGSLTHTLSVVNRIEITVSNDSLKAGENISLSADIFDQHGVSMTELLPEVQWLIINPQSGDLLLDSTGNTSSITATLAWRDVTIEAWVTDPKTGSILRATATVTINPGDPHHLDIQSDPQVSQDKLNSDTPQETIRLSSNSTSITYYAFVRDQFGNYVRPADPLSTEWISSGPQIASATALAPDAFAGMVSLSGNGTTQITVREGSLIPDTAVINAEAVAISDAITLDTDGDGLLDRVELHFDFPVTIDLQDNQLPPLTITYQGKTLPYTGITGLSGKTDSVFFIELDENDTWGLQTDWTVTINGTIPVSFSQDANGIMTLTDITTRDGAGPVIDKAVLYPGDQGMSDTLLVTLSEPISMVLLDDVLPETAFYYYLFTNESTPAIQVLQGSSLKPDYTLYSNQVTIICKEQNNPTFELTPFKDKMQFVAGSTDSAGNAPPGPAFSRKTIVELAGTNSINIAVLPNPMSPGSINLLPPSVRLSYANVIGNNSEGMLVALFSKKPLVLSINDSYGSAVVYDGVGNLISKNVDLKKAATSQSYGLFWNGRNENNRMVGPGSYLAVVNFEDIDGTRYSKKVKLGVKR